MAYEVKILPPEVPAEAKDAADDRPLGVRIVAGTVASALALAALPHGAACVKAESLASLLCKPQQLIRHDVHIEQASSTSTASLYPVALVNMTPGGTTMQPLPSRIGLTTYAPNVRIGSTDPSSGAALASSVERSA